MRHNYKPYIDVKMTSNSAHVVSWSQFQDADPF